MPHARGGHGGPRQTVPHIAKNCCILLPYTGQEDIIVGSLSADSLRKREGVGREEFVKGASQFCKYIKWKVDH